MLSQPRSEKKVHKLCCDTLAVNTLCKFPPQANFGKVRRSRWCQHVDRSGCNMIVGGGLGWCYRLASSHRRNHRAFISQPGLGNLMRLFFAILSFSRLELPEVRKALELWQFLFVWMVLRETLSHRLAGRATYSSRIKSLHLFPLLVILIIKLRLTILVGKLSNIAKHTQAYVCWLIR